MCIESAFLHSSFASFSEFSGFLKRTARIFRTLFFTSASVQNIMGTVENQASALSTRVRNSCYVKDPREKLATNIVRNLIVLEPNQCGMDCLHPLSLPSMSCVLVL